LGAAGAVQRAASLLQELGIRDALPNNQARSTVALTRRETEVLGLVARGLNNHEIASGLFISVRTVERHVSTIYAKIGAVGPSARAIATVHAIEEGLLQPIDPE
jgi:DNA-binding NarL/FixJ family response regulator